MSNNNYDDLLFLIFQREQMYSPENYSMPLRFELIGAKIDVEKLKSIGHITADKDVVCWRIKPYKTKEQEVLLIVDHEGYILFLDLEKLSNNIRCYNKILKEFNSLLLEKPLAMTVGGERDICKKIVNKLILEKVVQWPDLPAFYSMLRKINEINDVQVLSDIPLLCGNFRLKDEFYYTLLKLFNRRIELDARSIANIGMILLNICNSNFSAFMCFEKALYIDRGYEKAKEQLVVAAKRLMVENIDHNNYQWAVDAGENVLKIIGNPDEHDFYVILGFAYTMQCNSEMAKINYQNALGIDNDSYWAKILLNNLTNINQCPYENYLTFAEFIRNTR